MPTFRDTRTGEQVTVDSEPQVTRYLQRPNRYTEEVEQPPDGSVKEVLEWAGDDPDRRALALSAERAGKQRKGVIDALEG